MKTLLKLAVFSIAGIAMAQPIARPTYPAYAYPTNNGISTIYHQNKNTILSPPEVRSIFNTGGSNYIVLVRQDIPNSYHTSLINLGQYLNYFRYYKNDPNPKLVVYIAGGQGGNISRINSVAQYVGGSGGITIFTAPLANFIKTFGNNVSFYYVVGGEGESNKNGEAGAGGGASMVAVNNWPHDGDGITNGITLAIAGGGGGTGEDKGGWVGYNYIGGSGGGGGGGNDCGQNGNGVLVGIGGCNGNGGGDEGPYYYVPGWGSNNNFHQDFTGGIANPNLIDIAGGGGGAARDGGGGGTGTNGLEGYGSPQYYGGGGCGYQPGGNGFPEPTNCSNSTDPNYSGGIGPGGGNGGYGGGGGSSMGADAGGGGGYGGGGGAWVAGGGGGGGYCLDANHSPANNPSLGAELGSSCQAIDWKHPYKGVYGHYGNGFVEIYIEP